MAQITQTAMMKMPMIADGLLKKSTIFSLRAFRFSEATSSLAPGSGGTAGISSSMTPITGLPGARAG
jgi:hypothetical protein